MSIGEDLDGELFATTALRRILADPALSVVTDLPSTLPARLVRMTLAPGSRSGYDTTTLRLDIESFAPKRGDARDLAGRVHRAVAELVGQVIDGQMVDAVAGQLPVYRFWSQSVARYVGTYSWDLRVQPPQA